MILHKNYKKIFFSVYSIKMSNKILSSLKTLGYKDFYNYYDINVDKILLFKKSDNNISLDIMM